MKNPFESVFTFLHLRGRNKFIKGHGIAFFAVIILSGDNFPNDPSMCGPEYL